MAAPLPAATQLTNLHKTLSTLMLRATGVLLKVGPSESAAAASTLELQIHLAELGRVLTGHGHGMAAFKDPDVTAPEGPAGAHQRDAYEQCISSMGECVQTAVRAMMRLLAATRDSVVLTSGARGRLTLFEMTLRVVLALCGWFSMDLTPRVPKHLSALHQPLLTLMDWLVGFLRKDSAAMQLLRVCPPGAAAWELTVCALIRPSVTILQALQKKPPMECYLAVNGLPSGFIATLCCLVRESTPSQQRVGPLFESCMAEHTAQVYSLTELLGHFTFVHNDVGGADPINPELVCLASLEVVKHMVCLGDRACTKGLACRGKAAQLILGCLLSNDDSQTATTQASRMHGSEQRVRPLSHSSSSSSSLSSEMPSDLISDRTLLSVLIPWSFTDPLLAQGTTEILRSLVRGWGCEGTPKWHSPQGLLVCVAEVLRFCSHHISRLVAADGQPADQTLAQNAHEWWSVQRVLLMVLGLVADRFTSVDGE